MNKGQRVSSSSDSEEKQPLQPEDEDSTQHGSSSSSEDTSSDSDLMTRQMKRSQAFNCSFSLEEDQQPSSEIVQTQPPTRSSGVPGLVQSEPAAQCTHAPGQAESAAQCTHAPGQSEPAAQCTHAPGQAEPAAQCTHELGQAESAAHELGQEVQSSRSGLFKPQDLWLTVARCLSVRWPPCLSLNRLDRSIKKLAYQKDCNQSQKSFSSDSLDSANQSFSATSTSSEDINVTLVKKEEEGAKIREVKRCPTSRWGVSHSSPRLPRDRKAADLLLASMILEREMFLTVELIDRGEEQRDLRYQAEWKLSERSRQLAAGVWLSRTLID